ncbi:13419_t:CDS:2, partial [Gigaspora margarita]
FVRRKRYTILLALTIDGIIALDIIEELVKLVESLGGQVEFLSSYSPDFNPIETAFSSIKAWIKRYKDFFDSSDDPVYALKVACAHIT